MGWADNHIKDLSEGKDAKFRPHGNSMTGIVNDGQLVTVQSIDAAEHGANIIGRAVLCKVNGRQMLHKVLAVGSDGRFQIGNNKGHVNGWTTPENVYGLVVLVED